MTHDGLTDAFEHIHMGVTAENVAEDYGISREEQDAFAAESQQKAEQAIEDGAFKEEIVPVEVPQRKGDPKVVDNDEGPRAGVDRRHARQAARGVQEGRRDRDRGQRLGDQRRRRGDRRHVRERRPGARAHADGHRRELRLRRRGAADHGHRAHPGRRARRWRRPASSCATSTCSSSTRRSRRSRWRSARSSASRASKVNVPRRRHRPRPPHRRRGRAHPRHAPARDEAPRLERAGHAVRRRRPGPRRRRPQRNGGSRGRGRANEVARPSRPADGSGHPQPRVRATAR